MSKKTLIGFSLILLTLIIGCGIRSASYVDYKEDSEPAGATTTDDFTTDTTACTDGADLYLANIADTIDNSCATSSCHGSSRISGNTLTSADHAANRATLLAYEGTSESDLFDKIALQNNKSHAGGDFSAALSKESIDAWKVGEAACP